MRELLGKIRKLRVAGLLLALALTFTGCASGTDISADTTQVQEVVADVGSEQAEESSDANVAQEMAETNLNLNNEEEIKIATAEVKDEKDYASKEVDGTLAVHFIDVGQGDSIFISQDEHHMLIDAGENDCGTKVQSYLLANNVSTLDYVVGTHPDSDHIGGLDVILYKFDCKNILMPDFSKDTKTYEAVITTANQKGYKINSPKAGDTFALGDALVTVLAPKTGADYGDESNNYSIALKVTFGDNSFVFTGDCEQEAEEDIVSLGMDLKADVMKAGHHGSNTSNTEELLEAVAPSSVVISCGENNEYGHPRAEILNNLRSMGVQVYRTDEQGTIVAVSDGTEIIWNTSPSETWQAGEPKGSSTETNTTVQQGQVEKETAQEVQVQESEGEETQAQETQVQEAPVDMQGITYILNTNTMKIHYPHCSSVGQMSEQNKMQITSTVEELISQGYVPCKRCNP